MVSIRIIVVLILISQSAYGLKHCKGCLGSKWDAEIARQAEEKKAAELAQEKDGSLPQDGEVKQDAAAEQEIERDDACHSTNDEGEEREVKTEHGGLLNEEKGSPEHFANFPSQPDIMNTQQKAYSPEVSAPSVQTFVEPTVKKEVVKQQSVNKDVPPSAVASKDYNNKDDKEEILSSDERTILKRALQKIKRATEPVTKRKALAAASAAAGMSAIVFRLLQTSQFFRKIVSPSVVPPMPTPDIPTGPMPQPASPADGLGQQPASVIPEQISQPVVSSGASSVAQTSEQPSDPRAGFDASQIDIRDMSPDDQVRLMEANALRQPSTVRRVEPYDDIAEEVQPRASASQIDTEEIERLRREKEQLRVAYERAEAERLKAEAHADEERRKKAEAIAKNLRAEQEAARLEKEKQEAILRANELERGAHEKRSDVTPRKVQRQSTAEAVRQDEQTAREERLMKEKLAEAERRAAKAEKEAKARAGSSRWNKEELERALQQLQKAEEEKRALRGQINDLESGTFREKDNDRTIYE
jgi:hypothetical protein